jgi:hypothetical protein
MRRYFVTGITICFVAMLSVPVFVAISDQETDGPVTAGAWVSGSSELEAEGSVRATSVIRGAWGISVTAGSLSDGDSGHYPKGVNESYSVEEHTSTARAVSWITGYNKHGDTYSASAEEESGG